MWLVTRIRDCFKQEDARHDKLMAIFRPGKVVRHLLDGRCYEVVSADLHFVLLENKALGDSFVLDLMTPAGTLRTEIADEWEGQVTATT